jgi:hypothetical protein
MNRTLALPATILTLCLACSEGPLRAVTSVGRDHPAPKALLA